MKCVAASVAVAAAVSLTEAKVYFQEEFSGEWQSRWVTSNWKGEAEIGAFDVTPGKYFNNAETDAGLHTTTDARFYAASAVYDKFSSKGKDLVIQYQMKHEQDIQCGGGYIKVGPTGVDQKAFGDPTKYYVMFGPDECGSSKRTHLIFGYNGKNHLRKTDLRWNNDKKSHLFTLVVHADRTYDVYIDQKQEVTKGSLVDDFDMLAPRKINDPKASKPADWVDVSEIDDPEDKKPADWVDDAKVTDPEAKKPDDWDDEEDGAWEAPLKDNAAYKGPWSAKRIANPAYKGVWEHPQVDNPEFVDDESLGQFEDFGFVGVDVWQVKAGTIFDNIIICDDLKEAEEFAAKTWKPLSEVEGDKLAALEKETAEAAKVKDEAKAADISDDDDDDDDDEDAKQEA